jgi:redox-sensitive bicupin YhaK (pirin superfamily)
MTAGSGILHQEMPQGDDQGRMHGFQLWANLPSSLKMTAPRYQDVSSNDIPEVTDDDGTRVRVICGDFWGKVEVSRHAFAYVFEGAGTFRDASDPVAVRTDRVGSANQEISDQAGNRSLVLFDSGDEVTVQAGPAGVRFLLVSGKPLEEPVAWRGPIVMNTTEELQQAYAELRDGTFIRDH